VETEVKLHPVIVHDAAARRLASTVLPDRSMDRAPAPHVALVGFTVACTVLSAGCTIYLPPGYTELAEGGVSEAIPATPGRMFGCAPWSYDLPDGSEAIVRLDTGSTPFDDAFRFRVSAGNASMQCEANAPDARLRCRSTRSEPFELSFGASPGCGPAELDRLGFVSRASCWQGQVRVADEAFDFSYGTVGSTPFYLVSWLDAEGRPVQAYDGVVDMHVTLHRRADLREPERIEALRASAIALHFWSHTSFCDG
jgi:hypothetical protein